MVDISVVHEKLSGFETADELAEFFRNYGIVAQPRNARACAITKFVEIETGERNVITSTNALRLENEDGEQLCSFPHTSAMADFVEMYDKGCFSDLVEEGYEIEESSYNCCPECG